MQDRTMKVSDVIVEGRIDNDIARAAYNGVINKYDDDNKMPENEFFIAIEATNSAENPAERLQMFQDLVRISDLSNVDEDTRAAITRAMLS